MLQRLIPPQVRPAVRFRGHPAWLLAYAGLAVLLLLGWWGDGPLRPAWDALDTAVFRALNGGMADSRNLQMFWAVTNSRYFDIVLGIAILACYAVWMLAERRQRVVGRFLFGCAMAVFILLWMHEAMKWLLDFGRLSPTLVLPDAVRIGNAFEFIPKVKDFSRDSFPGDHFGVALMIGLILCHVAGWRVGGSLLLVALLSAFPRLAGGGHWFTDQVVGGGFCGLLGAALFLAPVWWRGRGTPDHQQ